jgi:hypothetical protein
MSAKTVMIILPACVVVLAHGIHWNSGRCRLTPETFSRRILWHPIFFNDFS